MPIRCRGRLASDDGFTIAELAIVLLMMGIVTAIVVANMDSFVRVANATEGRTNTLNDTRTALERMAKQVRAANPIDALAADVPISVYDTSLRFSVYCATPGSNACAGNHVRSVWFAVADYALTATIGDITGPLLNPSSPAAVPVAQRRGAVVNSASQPVFRYFDRTGQPFSTVAGVGPPSTSFRDCVKSVEIHLVVVAENRNPTKTIDLTTRVDLRNFNEVSGC